MAHNQLLASFSGAMLALACASTVSAAPVQLARLCGPPGTDLGMSVNAWKGLGFPGVRPSAFQPVCSDNPASARFLGVRTAAAPGDPIVCGYADRIGSTFLDDTVSFVDGFRARRLRYVFQAGKLARIDCDASDDSFDALKARFDRRYGPPKAILRDQVRTEIGMRQRVKVSWTIPGGSVIMVDPVRPATDLSLEYRARGD